MKIWKLVAGIVDLVIAVWVFFQASMAGVLNTLAENGECSGTAGFIVGAMLVAGGIVSIATRNKEYNKGNIALIVLFAIAALCGYVGAGSYTDLYIWASWCVINLILAVIALIKVRKINKTV